MRKKETWPLKRNKLIVMSIDALFDEDIPCIKELPNFNRLLKNSPECAEGCVEFIRRLPILRMFP